MFAALSATTGTVSAAPAETCATTIVQVPGTSPRMLRSDGQVWTPGVSLAPAAGETVTVTASIHTWDEYPTGQVPTREQAAQPDEMVMVRIGPDVLAITSDVPDAARRGDQMTAAHVVLTTGGQFTARHANPATVTRTAGSVSVDGPRLTVTRCTAAPATTTTTMPAATTTTAPATTTTTTPATLITYGNATTPATIPITGLPETGAPVGRIIGAGLALILVGVYLLAIGQGRGRKQVAR